MRFASGVHAVVVWSILLIAGCAQPSTTTTDTGEPGSATKLSTNEMFARLPDRDAADCLGRLEFSNARTATGQSTCGNRFSGTTDRPLEAGLVCVYSATPKTRTAAEVIAVGYFVCADSSTGEVRFAEASGRAGGVATVTADDGRVVNFTYEN